METKNEKFRRIVQKRLSRVFATMSLIENLSNKRYYEYTDDEVNEMIEEYMKKGLEIKEYFERPIKKKELTKKFIFETQHLINNEKNYKFRELAQNRLSKVFDDMNLIANLSNKSNYKYSEKEIEEIFEAYEQKGFETRGHFIIRDEFTFKS